MKPSAPKNECRRSSAKLLSIGAIIARKQLTIALGSRQEALEARAVIAGLLAAVNVFISDRQFELFVIGNEINGAMLRTLHEIIYSDPTDQSDPTEIPSTTLEPETTAPTIADTNEPDEVIAPALPDYQPSTHKPSTPRK